MEVIWRKSSLARSLNKYWSSGIVIIRLVKDYIAFILLANKEAVDIAIKITDAVHYMHSQDPIVIHQDLKPQNVLVSLLGDIVIAYSPSGWGYFIMANYRGNYKE